MTYHNLNGGIQDDEEHQWCYYHFQTNTGSPRVYAVRQRTPLGQSHGALVNSNCPERPDPRVSIEVRAAVFMPTKKEVVAEKVP